jgi:hypothetical protein
MKILTGTSILNVRLINPYLYRVPMSNKHELRYSTLEIETQVSVVTGSSSRIGLETSVLLAENGFHTYASVSIILKNQKH